MVDFFDRSAADLMLWNHISKMALKRVESRYTWRLYAERMMTLSRIYGFWKFVSNLEHEETMRYLICSTICNFVPWPRDRFSMNEVCACTLAGSD